MLSGQEVCLQPRKHFEVPAMSKEQACGRRWEKLCLVGAQVRGSARLRGGGRLRGWTHCRGGSGVT